MSLLIENTETEQSTVLGSLFRFMGELLYSFNTMNPEDKNALLPRFITHYKSLEQLAVESGLKKLQNALQELYIQTKHILEHKDSWEQAQREYQALFFAPDLPVPLWESIYLSQQKIMFTEETTAVREWYHRFDLDISTVGYEAEDHIAFELFFCGWLFDKTTINTDKNLMKNDPSLDDFEQFIHEHIGLWGIECLTSLEKNSVNLFWVAAFSTAKNLLETVIQE